MLEYVRTKYYNIICKVKWMLFFSNKKARLVKILGFIIVFIIFLKTN